MRHNLAITLAVFSLLVGGVVHAQTLDGQNTTIQFEVDPEVPGPNQQVTIDAQGVGGFLGDAMITWQQNGKTALSGAGEHSFSFFTGGVGTQTKIHVVVNSPSLGTFTKDFTFIPTLVNLLWEANTSVPPLYRGKALYSPGSQIKIIALPQVVSNGALLPASRLSYKWSVGDEPATDRSGLGRSTFTFSGNQLNPSETVSVDVYFGSTLVGHGAITIPATQPDVLFYVQDSLRGTLLDQALPSSIALAGQEVTLNAQPLYFASESIGNSLTYNWALNNQTVTGPNTSKGLLTLRQTGGGVGQSLVSLDLQNSNTSAFLQTVSAKLNIIFGQQTGSAASGFGL
jgi:hypothetical protein